MKQTLFIIPQDWFQTWIIGLWLLVGIIIVFAKSRGTGLVPFLRDFLPVFLIGGALIYFVLPRASIPVVNLADPAGEYIPGGLAIRGYGVFLMLAILSSLALVAVRCRQEKINVDQALTLCFVMIITGLIGARLFYVVQKWEEFRSGPLTAILDMTQGGLVVYGSLIGGLVGAFVYFWISKLPVRATLDVLAPAMALGLAIGRLGCLMNGCCYGGQCSDTFPLGISFPAGSPPYMRQIEDGSLLGIQSGTLYDSKQEFPVQVKEVRPGSPAVGTPLSTGDQLAIFAPDALRLQALKEHGLDFPLSVIVVPESTREPVEIPAQSLPSRSLKIHPTQIYAAVNAFLLCGLLYFWHAIRTFAGQVFALLMILYPISRFLEEMIRTDEQGMFGTQFSIGQWVSLATIAVGFAFYIVLSNIKQNSSTQEGQ